jgi:Trp operon repressor
MKKKNKYVRDLINIIQKISKDKKLLSEFLIDLFTPTEYKKIILRWQIIKQLADGIPQRQIAKNLNVSVGTITRGSRELQDEQGGFYKYFETIRKK